MKGSCDEIGEEPVFLPPDEAFILQSATQQKNSVIQLNFKIAPGYQLYHHSFQFRTLEGDIIEPTKVLFPTPLAKRDTILNEDYLAYENMLSLKVSIPAKTAIGLRVEYQGCAIDGYCYNPIAKKILFSMTGVATITDLSSTEFKTIDQAIEALSEIESTIGSNPGNIDNIIQQLKTGSFPITILLFLGLGILLAFTPCVLPMIPILANILVGSEVALSNRRAALLTTLYILSVAVCYAIAGTLAGIMGEQFQVVLQKPIFLVGLSFLLLLFALSQLSIIHIQLPQIFTHTLHHLQQKQKQGSMIGAITMGFISALMVSPCVTPALVGALTYIGQTGNALLGGMALFAMALGMGLPLLIAATIGTHLLPKTGAWMSGIKIITGILLLILAISILNRAFPTSTSSQNELQASFTNIQDENDLTKALQTAKAAHQPALLQVTANWCPSCGEIEKTVFSNPAVHAALDKIVLLRLDISEHTDANAHLQKSLTILGPPTILFFDREGQEIKNLRLVGLIKITDFIQRIQALKPPVSVVLPIKK